MLLGGLCYSARDIVIMGISAAAFGAFFVTLWVCRRQGVLAGAAAGLILGVAYEPVYAPLFVLAGIAEGLLYGVSPTLAAAAAFASGMTWGCISTARSAHPAHARAAARRRPSAGPSGPVCSDSLQTGCRVQRRKG